MSNPTAQGGAGGAASRADSSGRAASRATSRRRSPRIPRSRRPSARTTRSSRTSAPPVREIPDDRGRARPHRRRLLRDLLELRRDDLGGAARHAAGDALLQRVRGRDLNEAVRTGANPRFAHACARGQPVVMLYNAILLTDCPYFTTAAGFLGPSTSDRSGPLARESAARRAEALPWPGRSSKRASAETKGGAAVPSVSKSGWGRPADALCVRPRGADASGFRRRPKSGAPPFR